MQVFENPSIQEEMFQSGFGKLVKFAQTTKGRVEAKRRVKSIFYIMTKGTTVFESENTFVYEVDSERESNEDANAAVGGCGFWLRTKFFENPDAGCREELRTDLCANEHRRFICPGPKFWARPRYRDWRSLMHSLVDFVF